MAAGILMLASLGQAQEQTLSDLTVDKQGPDQVAPGSEVVYTFYVTNQGTAQANFPADGSIPIARDEPAGQANFISNRAPTGYDFNHNVTVVDFIAYPPGTVRTLNPGDTVGGFEVTLRAPNNTGSTIVNCAYADPFERVFELDETNNTDCVTTTVVEPSPDADSDGGGARLGG